VRATLGVVAVLMLDACFGFAADLNVNAGPGDTSLRVKTAAVAAVFTAGMAVVAVIVPSAVAAGLAVLGLESAVLLSMLAAGGVGVTGYVVAGLLTALFAIAVGLRLPMLRRHPSGLGWILGVGAVLAAVASSGLSSGGSGMSVASAGLLGVALAILAWRHRSVLAAVAAVPPLFTVEGYLVEQSVGGSATEQATAALVIGIALVVAVAVVTAITRGRLRTTATARLLRPEEVLLAGAAVFALLALGQEGPSLPFLRGFSELGTTPQIQESFVPLPIPVPPSFSVPQLRTPPAFPTPEIVTFPPFPPFQPFPTAP